MKQATLNGRALLRMRLGERPSSAAYRRPLGFLYDDVARAGEIDIVASHSGREVEIPGKCELVGLAVVALVSDFDDDLEIRSVGVFDSYFFRHCNTPRNGRGAF